MTLGGLETNLSGRARERGRSRGVALLTALALLFVFSVLGMAYLRFMEMTIEEARSDLRGIQASQVAEGGVRAAVAELQAALASGGDVAGLLGVSREYGLPVYAYARDAGETRFAEREDRRATVRVTIADESGKLNPNYASASELERVLGIDGAASARIRAGLPGHGAPGNGRWLASVDELATRGLMDTAAFERVDRGLLSVHTAAKAGDSRGILNVNAASPEVLAAILDVSLEDARRIRGAGPFRDSAGFCAAAGKAVGSPAPELAFSSRCYRIVGEAEVTDVGPQGQTLRATHRRVEAVVVLDDGGKYRTTYWSEAPEGERDGGPGDSA